MATKSYDEHIAKIEQLAKKTNSNGNEPPKEPPINGVTDVPENPKKSELDQIRYIQNQDTNFVFIFGGPLRGKTVVTSSIVNFLSNAVESKGQLIPLTNDQNEDNGSNNKSSKDHGNILLQKILRLFAEQRFPARTVLVDDDEPIYLNVKFSPDNTRDHKNINLTFLEMPGDQLQVIDSPEGGFGDLPTNIDVFFKTVDTSILFILLTEHQLADKDDQLIATFIDYVRSKSKNFTDTGFLLLVSKWDKYKGDLTVDQFVEKKMRLTYSKLHNSKNSISSFSIGEVDGADEVPFLKKYNPIPAKRVINWIYESVHGKPLFQKTFFERILSKFLKYS